MNDENKDVQAPEPDLEDVGGLSPEPAEESSEEPESSRTDESETVLEPEPVDEDQREVTEPESEVVVLSPEHLDEPTERPESTPDDESKQPFESKDYQRLAGVATSYLLLMVALGVIFVWTTQKGWLKQLAGHEAAQDTAPKSSADPHAEHQGGGPAVSGGHDPSTLTEPVQIMVTQRQRLLANVGTEPSRIARTSGHLRALGKVTVDETTRFDVTAWIDGRIDALSVKETGELVKEGETIARIYSPELLEAQEVLLTALASQGNVTSGLVKQARKRLKLLGMSSSAIEKLEKKGVASNLVSIKSRATGTVLHRHVNQGEYVKQGGLLFEVADLNRVWVEAEVFERDLGLVELGASAKLRSQGSGESLAHEAVVSFIYPYLDDQRRTTRVRLEVENSLGTLRPNQYVDVLFEVPQTQRVVVVPAGAVVRTGGHPRLWVEVEKGVFEARVVELGAEHVGGLVVRSGLKPGESVVTSGTFMVDSQATLEQPHAMMALSAGSHPFHPPGHIPTAKAPGADPHEEHRNHQDHEGDAP